MIRLKVGFVIPSSMALPVFLSFYAFLIASVLCYGANPQAGALDYIEGIDALESADFTRAVTSLTRAVQADDENAAYHRARGVANALAERVPEALADLQRALKLNPADREARLWLGLAYYMSGEPAKASMNYPHGGDISTHYANLVHNDVGAVYFASRYHGNYFDRESRENVKVKEPVKTKFPEAARVYALRHRAAGADASEAVAARLKANLERGTWEDAIKDLNSLRLNAPDDPVLRGQYAEALLGTGNALSAREEFTRALSIRPSWAEGYLGRAMAAAILGDQRRVKSDLEAAATLGAKTGPTERKVKEFAKAVDLDEAKRKFSAVLKEKSELPTILNAAFDLCRAAHAVRANYDEGYQDRIFILSEGVRAQPNNPDRHEILARYLYNYHIVPKMWNGPRSEGEQLRPQSKEERTLELKRALQSANAALKLDNKHAGAMAAKGWVLYTLGQRSELERLADEGLKIEPKSVRLLSLKAQILIDQAVALTAQVVSLRQGRSETSRETRSDGVYEVRRYYAPSAEQLAQAAALEAEAVRLRNQAASLNKTALQVREQVVPQLLAEGDKLLAADEIKQARRVLQQAYRYDPDQAALCSRLAQLCKREGNSRDQRMFALLAEPIQHTSASDQLKFAWEHIERTAWTSAEEALSRAESVDPSDPRISAYRSVVWTNRAMLNDAARERRAVVALKESQAKLMGTSLFNMSRNVPDLNEAGLAMAIILHDGNALLESKDYENAMKSYSRNVNLEKAWREDRLVQLVPSAILPDPNIEEGRIPEVPTLASLLAWSRIGIAQALLGLNRPEEARGEFKAVRAYLANWPPTSKDRQTMFVVDAWAQLGLAEAAYAEKDYETAFKLLMREGSAGALPEKLERRKRELSGLVVERRKQVADDAMQVRRNMSPQERRKDRMQQQIVAFEEQRDAMKKELESPRLDQRQKKALRESISQMDQMIQNMKESSDETGAVTRPRPQNRNVRSSQSRIPEAAGRP